MNGQFDQLISYSIMKVKEAAEAYRIPVYINGELVGEYQIDREYINNMISAIKNAGK